MHLTHMPYFATKMAIDSAECLLNNESKEMNK